MKSSTRWMIRLVVLAMTVVTAVVIVNSRQGNEYDTEAFRNTLIDQGNGDWCTPDGHLFVDGTLNVVTGMKEASHVEARFHYNGTNRETDRCPNLPL